MRDWFTATKASYWDYHKEKANFGYLSFVIDNIYIG
jgi:hypothetical protein